MAAPGVAGSIGRTGSLEGRSQMDPDVAHVQVLLDSFARLLGRELLPRTGSPERQCEALFTAPFVVVSHGAEPDPLLTYGNAAALALWEMTAAEFRGTPSRFTAEPVHREERARLLDRTRRRGYVDDYSGVRISRSGRRFRVERAIVWNLATASGAACGQAATFDRWTLLPVAADGDASIMPRTAGSEPPEDHP